MEKFVCTQCGHHFTAEPAESVICPRCFWSTSVKKDEEKSPVAMPKAPSKRLEKPPARPIRPALFFGKGVLLSGILFLGISLFVLRYLQSQREVLQKIDSKNAEVISTHAPELSLAPEGQEILFRRVARETKRELTESEQAILARHFSFSAPRVRGLPSPPWDQKQFEAFLKEEELHYRIRLERSYRRKLEELFKKHYAAAAKAFEEKDYLKARDEWIRSLTFPIYRNEVERHRGVVLTMLRSFINDTLLRIGALNALLTEKDLYEKEEKIKGLYQEFYAFLQEPSWEEANAKLLELQTALPEAERTQAAVATPPPPPEVTQVDAHLREVILAQVAPSTTSAPDWEALRRDLEEKERIIQSRLPESLEAAQKKYGEALALIQNRRWEEARAILESIDFPEELAKDAEEKLKVLSQLASLDSGERNG